MSCFHCCIVCVETHYSPVCQNSHIRGWISHQNCTVYDGHSLAGILNCPTRHLTETITGRNGYVSCFLAHVCWNDVCVLNSLLLAITLSRVNHDDLRADGKNSQIAGHLELNIVVFITLNSQERVRKPKQGLSFITAMKWMLRCQPMLRTLGMDEKDWRQMTGEMWEKPQSWNILSLVWHHSEPQDKAAAFSVVLTNPRLATASHPMQDLRPQGPHQPSQGLLLTIYSGCVHKYCSSACA